MPESPLCLLCGQRLSLAWQRLPGRLGLRQRCVVGLGVLGPASSRPVLERGMGREDSQRAGTQPPTTSLGLLGLPTPPVGSVGMGTLKVPKQRGRKITNWTTRDGDPHPGP